MIPKSNCQRVSLKVMSETLSSFGFVCTGVVRGSQQWEVEPGRYRRDRRRLRVTIPWVADAHGKYRFPRIELIRIIRWAGFLPGAQQDRCIPNKRRTWVFPKWLSNRKSRSGYDGPSTQDAGSRSSTTRTPSTAPRGSRT